MAPSHLPSSAVRCRRDTSMRYGWLLLTLCAVSTLQGATAQPAAAQFRTGHRSPSGAQHKSSMAAQKAQHAAAQASSAASGTSSYQSQPARRLLQQNAPLEPFAGAAEGNASAAPGAAPDASPSAPPPPATWAWEVPPAGNSTASNSTAPPALGGSAVGNGTAAQPVGVNVTANGTAAFAGSAVTQLNPWAANPGMGASTILRPPASPRFPRFARGPRATPAPAMPRPGRAGQTMGLPPPSTHGMDATANNPRKNTPVPIADPMGLERGAGRPRHPNGESQMAPVETAALAPPSIPGMDASANARPTLPPADGPPPPSIPGMDASANALPATLPLADGPPPPSIPGMDASANAGNTDPMADVKIATGTQAARTAAMALNKQGPGLVDSAHFIDAINKANAAVNQTGYIPTLPNGLPTRTMVKPDKPKGMSGGSVGAIKVLKPADDAASGGGNAGFLPRPPKVGAVGVDTRADAMAPGAAAGLGSNGAPALAPVSIFPAAITAAQPPDGALPAAASAAGSAVPAVAAGAVPAAVVSAQPGQSALGGYAPPAAAAGAQAQAVPAASGVYTPVQAASTPVTGGAVYVPAVPAAGVQAESMQPGAAYAPPQAVPEAAAQAAAQAVPATLQAVPVPGVPGGVTTGYGPPTAGAVDGVQAPPLPATPSNPGL